MKRILSLLLTMTIIMGTLYGCGTQSGGKNDTALSSNTPVVLNEVAHSIFYAPMYVAIEEGYFAEEGIDLTLVTGFGADKTMTALLTDEADIGFMGSESTIYTYAEGASDYAVNFAQLTQRAGNFLVSREPIDDFEWDMLIGKNVLGGRAGGMPEMVFEYILKKNNINPATDVMIDQSIDFGSTAAAFSGGQGDFSVVRVILLHPYKIFEIIMKFFLYYKSVSTYPLNPALLSLLMSTSDSVFSHSPADTYMKRSNLMSFAPSNLAFFSASSFSSHFVTSPNAQTTTTTFLLSVFASAMCHTLLSISFYFIFVNYRNNTHSFQPVL